jgi:hypothetical protein
MVSSNPYDECRGWKIRAKERFAGPFTGNTSFPILFIGNTLVVFTSTTFSKATNQSYSADPVTSLRR